MVSDYIKKLLKDKARLKKWKKITLALSCVVVFCVVYALTLPAITLEGKTICGMEEHTHTEECYQDDKLICDKEEHQHTEDCYEKEEEQPVEEENTQEDTTESSDEVETVAEPEDNKQDESNEEEQQESTQVTSADFDLSAHPSNIKNITLSYKDSNGNWVNIDSNGNQTIPGNAKIKLNVDYFNINIDQLINNGEYSYSITYAIPDLLSNAQTAGIITQDSKEVGRMSVQNGVVSLKLKNEYLKQLKTNENSSLTGDFYVEGDVNLSKLYPDGQVTVTTGDKTYNLNFGPDVFAQYGDLKIEKTLLNNSKVISVNGEDYLSYAIKVTTGNVGCPDVKVVDTFTNNQDLVTYVGVTTNKTDLVGNPYNQEPYETIVNGKQHGSVYLGTTSSDKTPIPEENTKKDNETGSLVWAIGDMSANETRILTYFVKLKENEPLNKKGAISNNANVYSKTYPRHSSNAPFNPIVSYGMNKKQEGSTIRNEDGSYTINYKLDFTLKPNSNYALKDFEIMDYLDYSDHYVNEKIRKYVSYNKDSFKVSVQKSNGITKELEENEYKLAWAKGDTNYKTEWGNNDGNPTRFKITGSDKSPIIVDPGDSYYVTYSVTVQPEALAVMKSNSVQISNRYLVNASNAKHEYRGWDFLDRVARDLSVGEYKWDEKTVKESIATSQEIKMSGDVYDGSLKSDTTDRFTVPAGSYPYIVTVNDTQGVWDATEVKMTDTLSPKNMEYVGYAKVEAFEYNKDSNEYSLAGTKWVKIDRLNTFALSPKQIGWDKKDYKYVFTYYAKPVNLENYSKTQVTNTFELIGEVKKGDVSIDISNIKSSKTVEFSGSYNMNVRKSSWYYQEPEPDAQTWKNGALYWVIEVSGTSIKEDTVFKDSIVKNSDKEEDKLSYLHDDSLVGIYKGTSIDNYKTIDDLKTSENFTDVRGSFGELKFTGTNGNYDSLEISVKNKIPLNEKEKVFMIVKSEPSVRPTNYRDAFNFSNKVSTKDDGINFMDRSTATKTLYCGGDILKELGQTFQYNKESSKIETIVADKDVNIPAGSESRIYKKGLNETGSGIYASWAFKLNLAGDLSGSYRVLENIPDGMQLAYMRIKWIGAEQKKRSPIVSKSIGNLENGWTEKSTKANDDDNESRTTIYYVKGNQALIELGDFYPGKVNDKYSVDVQVVCKVTDSNVLLGNKEKEFMNTVVLQTRDGNDITSASSPVKMEISNLDKSYIPVTENNKNTNKVNFTINTNQLGQQLPNNEGSKLKLIDKLSDTLILDTSSIKAVKTGTEEVVDINASLGEDNTLEIELPNNIPITITYTATVNAAPNQTVGFSNEAYWKNYSSSGQKVEEKNYSYEAGGTVSGAQNPVLKITKKDKNHLNMLLENASFKMVECEMNEGTIKDTDTSWQGTTDKNGNLELGTGTKLMQYNTIYKVTEEKVPNGYVDEKYSCYIMVVKDDGSKEYKTYYDHKDWYSNVKIQYQSTYELTVTNHKGEITVEKKFLNVAGHDSNPVSGTYKFGLYKDKDAVNKPIQIIEITYKTGDLNANSEKFEDLNLNETYYVYELDDQNNPITDSNVHVINRLEYITSYSTNNAVQNGATVTVTNQNRVKQLPSTGSYGTLIYRISGAMLVLASLIFLTNINKKNHLNDKSKNRRKQ